MEASPSQGGDIKREDSMNHTRTRISRGALALLALAITLSLSADTTSDDKEIRELIATYAATVDRADTAMAERIFSDSSDLSFIHPRGEVRGRQQIVTDVIQNLRVGPSQFETSRPKGS
jgi:hypothetical protein